MPLNNHLHCAMLSERVSNDAHSLATKVISRLAARLPEVFDGIGSTGQKVVINISPGAKTVIIEWPPDIEHIRHDK